MHLGSQHAMITRQTMKSIPETPLQQQNMNASQQISAVKKTPQIQKKHNQHAVFLEHHARTVSKIASTKISNTTSTSTTTVNKPSASFKDSHATTNNAPNNLYKRRTNQPEKHSLLQSLLTPKCEKEPREKVPVSQMQQTQTPAKKIKKEGIDCATPSSTERHFIKEEKHTSRLLVTVAPNQNFQAKLTTPQPSATATDKSYAIKKPTQAPPSPATVLPANNAVTSSGVNTANHVFPKPKLAGFNALLTTLLPYINIKAKLEFILTQRTAPTLSKTERLIQYPKLIQHILNKSEFDINLYILLGDDLTVTLNGWNALHHAVIVGECKIIEALLHAGMDANAEGVNGITPMHFLVIFASKNPKSDFNDILTLLLQYKADINKRDNRDVSPLTLALQLGNSALSKTLIEQGAEVETDLQAIAALVENIENNYDLTNFHFTENFADHDLINEKISQYFHQLCRLLGQTQLDTFQNESIGMATCRTPPPILQTILDNDLEQLKKILANKKSDDKKSDDKKSDDKKSDDKKRSTGYEEISLLLAAMLGKDYAVPLLLDAGIMANTKTGENISSLHCIIQYCTTHKNIMPALKILDALLEKNANINQKSKDNITPLDIALIKNSFSIAGELLKRGAKIRADKRLINNLHGHVLESLKSHLNKTNHKGLSS